MLVVRALDAVDDVEQAIHSGRFFCVGGRDRIVWLIQLFEGQGGCNILESG